MLLRKFDNTWILPPVTMIMTCTQKSHQQPLRSQQPGLQRVTMFSSDSPSFKLVAAEVTSLVDAFKTEYGYWPGLTEVYYRSTNEELLPRTLESLKLIRRMALYRNYYHIRKWTEFQ